MVKKNRVGYRIFGFDTETVDYGRGHELYSIQLYSEPEGGVILYRDNWCEIKNFERTVFATNNARFDFVMIRHMFPNARVRVNRSKVFRIDLDPEKRLFLVDIFNFFQSSLEELGKKFGFPKLKKPDYLGKREPTQDERKYFEEYAINDAKVSYHIYKYIVKDFSTVDLTGAVHIPRPFSTAASLAYSQFRKETGFKIQVMNADLHGLYHGGRTECIGYGRFDNVYVFDFNSLYPYCASVLSFPDMEKPVISADFSYEGATFAEVEIFKQHLPPLCVKLDKLYFPYGRLRSWFTNIELRYIHDNKLGEVKRIIDFRNYEEMPSPFRSWVLKHYENKLRAEKSGNTPLRNYEKLLLNSFCGRLALRLQRAEVRTSPPDDWHEWEEISGLWIKRDAGKPRLSRTSNLIWASYITAKARLYLHETVKDDDGFIYCDTDSIHTTNPERYSHMVSDELGKLKEEGDKEGKNYYFRAKSYITTRDGSIKNGKIYIKGLPRREIIYNEGDFFIKGATTTIHVNPLSPKKLGLEEPLVRTVFFTFDGKRILPRQINPLSENVITQPMKIEMF
jgi:DNA polymerase elongation subunit (family B)